MAMVRAIRVDPNSPIAWEILNIGLVTAISQTGLVAFAYTPGYAFQIVKIKTFCSNLAGVVSSAVQIASRTAASPVFTAATEVTATLSATLANIRGGVTDQLTFNYTTNGAGVLTNAQVSIIIRPYPWHGEATTGP